jgi:hypothetical protein
MDSTIPALPGAELIAKGQRDLARGVETIESLLVSVGAPRVRATGDGALAPFEDAELRLYRLLRAQHGDAAHSRYNALIRQLVSYERAAACVK